MAFTTQGDNVPVIDVHFHYFMPDVLGPMKEFVIATPEERHTAMEKLHTRTIIYSPVIWSKYNTEWPADKWVDLCRKFTDHQAAEVEKAPASVGSFAPLPFPHVTETIEALEYAEEQCSTKPDGYAITTSSANKYLGDASYGPILAECNRCGVVLFVHPNETVMPPLDPKVYGWQMIEFPTETARCLMSMVDQGTFTKYPDIKWIFSHNGGSFPYLFQRCIRTLSGSKLVGVGGPGAKQVNRIANNNAGQTLQHVFGAGNIYIECSQGTAVQTVMLKSLGVRAENVLTGSDWPFTGKDDVASTLEEMYGPEKSGMYTPQEIELIRAGNALRLFPRLKAEYIKSAWLINE
ncbi:hypothetical protein EDB81DRAFT_764329 [Dactylonectria macrodidyma]|uniref:Amidohydrolase-related domain-containing protein n=1 Tax=Dactylonectria macrodidyma TaxID=307937 RepID=A0A9P9E1Z5_9HYPO|nr:hypothetical protein EDB81DRAFT_764329 [Dactylonectria macrodidyma]